VSKNYYEYYAHAAIRDIFTKVGIEPVLLWIGKDDEIGTRIQLYKNGQIKELSHYGENGIPHGEYKQWYPNGQLWTHCIYKYDVIYGEYKLWDKAGKFKIHEFYRNKNEMADESLPKELKKGFIMSVEGKYYAD